MKSTAPKELGILVIAAVFGIIGGGVALVMYGVSFIWALVVAGIVATVSALALWFGWREPAPREIGARPLGPKTKETGVNPAQVAGTAGMTPGTAGPAPGSAGVAAGAAPAAEETSVVADAPTEPRDVASEKRTPVTSSTEKPGLEAARVNPSSRLPGEEDLASRKGEWRYARDHDAGASGTAPSAADATKDRGATVEASADPGAAGSSEAQAQPARGSSVATPNGAAVSTGAQTAESDDVDAPTEADKPATLTQARDGGADNLKEIKGVGPKLEVMLHDMGIYHFDQIASWSDRELAWVDDNLTGFKGRASRDEWVSQAKVLASGEETEFSERVDRGDVY